MPVKKFVSQEVAYASDVNTYLMNQVVAVFYDDGARTAAYSAAGITPTAGMLSFLTINNKVYYYDGSGWQTASEFAPPAGSITTTELANGSVTTAKLADLGVTTAKLADLGVTTAKLADLAVTTAKIADTNVTTGKIADNAVASSKFRTSISTSVVGNPTGGTANVSDIQASSDSTVLRRNGSTLEFAKIANVNVADNAGITSTKLGPLSITAHTGANNDPVSASYANQLITVNSASAFNIGLPHSEISFPAGTTISIMQLGAGKVTITSHDGAQILTPVSGAQSTRAQYSVVTAIKIEASPTAANNKWLLAGDLST